MKSLAVPILLLLGAACSAPVAETTQLRVLSYNVKHGYGNEGQGDIGPAAALIKELNPDFVVLQEIDSKAERSGKIDQVQRLSELTGLHARFGAFMPYQGGEYGMGLLSRYPIIDSTNHRLPDGLEPRTALDAQIGLPNGDEIILIGIHLYHSEEKRLAQAQRIVEIYADTELPMLVGGDFNSRPNTVVMDLVGQHWTNPDKGEDCFTMSATDPRAEIDFILFRPQDRFEIIHIDALDETLVSDHRPVLLDFELRSR